MATFIPGLSALACGGSGGTDSPRYCYAVWLRHVAQLAAAGVNTEFAAVAELGPGDSLGIGLCSVLTGADKYFALDAKPHAVTPTNVKTLRQLFTLFERREPVPGKDEFPALWPPVKSPAFPDHILTPQRLSRTASAARVDAIERALGSGEDGDIVIRYAAPWTASSIVRTGLIDLAVSQAVLEHVEDIDSTYDALFRWLKPGGVMSHQIDFKSHGLTRDWFGHWTIPRSVWSLVRGRRSYLINRLPASAHLTSMARAGFDILVQSPVVSDPPARRLLAREFQELSEEDLRTSGIYVIARKPEPLP